MNNVNERVTTAVTSSKRIVANAEQFVQASALLITTAFSYWSLHEIKVDEWLQWVVTVSLVVVGLRAFIELIKFLDKEK